MNLLQLNWVLRTSQKFVLYRGKLVQLVSRFVCLYFRGHHEISKTRSLRIHDSGLTLQRTLDSPNNRNRFLRPGILPYFSIGS